MAVRIGPRQIPSLQVNPDQNFSFGDLVLKVRTLFQSAANKTPTSFTHKDWLVLTKRIPSLLEQLNLKAPEAIKEKVHACVRSLIFPNAYPKEWSELKTLNVQNHKAIEDLYRTFISMKRSSPEPESVSSNVSFASAAQGSSMLQEIPKMPITLAYLVQILNRIAKGNYGEALKEALENRNEAIFNAQTICKLVLFEATRTLPVPSERFPEIARLGDKYSDRVDQEFEEARKKELMECVFGIASDNDLEEEYQKLISEYNTKITEWKKIKSEFQAKFLDVVSLLIQTNDLEAIVFGKGDHSTLNQVVSTLQIEHTREEFTSLMTACNQISNLSELTNAFPTLPLLIAHFQSLLSEHRDRQRNVMLVMLMLSQSRTQGPSSLFDSLSDEEDDPFMPPSLGPLVHSIHTAISHNRNLAGHGPFGHNLESNVANLSTPALNERIKTLMSALIAEGEHTGTFYLNTEISSAVRALYSSFKLRLTELNVSLTDSEAFSSHVTALFQMIERAMPTEPINGLLEKIDAVKIAIKIDVRDDMIAAFARQPLLEITIEKYKRFAERLPAFNVTATTPEIAEMVMRQAIKKHHAPFEFVDLFNQFNRNSDAESKKIASFYAQLNREITFDDKGEAYERMHQIID